MMTYLSNYPKSHQRGREGGRSGIIIVLRYNDQLTASFLLNLALLNASAVGIDSTLNADSNLQREEITSFTLTLFSRDILQVSLLCLRQQLLGNRHFLVESFRIIVDLARYMIDVNPDQQELQTATLIRHTAWTSFYTILFIYLFILCCIFIYVMLW